MRKYRRQRKTDGQRILNCHPTGTAIISVSRNVSAESPRNIRTSFCSFKRSSTVSYFASPCVIWVDVNKTTTSSNNYSNLSTAIATQRTSVSGVDEDEEAMNLIKFQNAYNLASKMISVMSEMYDKLIKETGVV